MNHAEDAVLPKPADIKIVADNKRYQGSTGFGVALFFQKILKRTLEKNR
jgi:hypothetical protein